MCLVCGGVTCTSPVSRASFHKPVGHSRVFFCQLSVDCCSGAQLCPPLCSPPGFCVHGPSQARIPEWVAISTSWGPSRCMGQSCVSSTGRRALCRWAPGKLVQPLGLSSLVCLPQVLVAACGPSSLARDGTEPPTATPRHRQRRVLATGPPGKSLDLSFKNSFAEEEFSHQLTHPSEAYNSA